MRRTMNKQYGGNLPVFRGSSFQRGYGLGSFFKSLARSAIPLLKKGAKTVGKALLNTGADIAKDIASGNNLQESLNTRVNQTIKGLGGARKTMNQNGRGMRQHSTGRKPIKRKAPQQKVIKRGAKKAKGSRTVQDIFS